MKCDQLRDLMPEYLLGGLDTEEEQELRAHLNRGCLICTAAMAEAEALLGRLADIPSPIDPPDRLRESLFARIHASGSQPAEIKPSSVGGTHAGNGGDGVTPANRITPPFRTTRFGRFCSWLRAQTAVVILGSLFGAAACAAGAGIGGLAVWQYTQSKIASRDTEINWMHAMIGKRKDEIGALQRAAMEVAALPDALRAKTIEFIELRSGDAQSETPRGRILWDHDRRQWHVFATGLNHSDANTSYTLWCVSEPDHAVNVATMAVTPDGDVAVLIDVPPTAEQATLIAVTETRPNRQFPATDDYVLVARLGEP